MYVDVEHEGHKLFRYCPETHTIELRRGRLLVRVDLRDYLQKRSANESRLTSVEECDRLMPTQP